MKVKLTKKLIDSVDYTAKGTEIYMDDVLTGFALRDSAQLIFKLSHQKKLFTMPRTMLKDEHWSRLRLCY